MISTIYTYSRVEYFHLINNRLPRSSSYKTVEQPIYVIYDGTRLRIYLAFENYYRKDGYKINWRSWNVLEKNVLKSTRQEQMPSRYVNILFFKKNGNKKRPR